MKEILKLLVEETSRRANRKIEESIVRNAFLFTMSSLMGIARLMVQTKNGTLKYANFFGITIASSGDGKDLSLSICEEVMGLKSENYINAVIANYKKLNNKLPSGDMAYNNELGIIVPESYKVAMRGTIEGVMRVGNFYNSVTKGTLNVISTEFGSEISDNGVMTLLTTLWQEASAEGSTTVNEKYKRVTDVPTNLIFFGSAAPFNKDSKKQAQLAQEIESGLGRRTIFAMSNNEDIEIYSSEENHTEVLSEFFEAVRRNILTKKVIEISHEANEVLDKYKEDLINEYNQKKTEWNRIRISNIDKIERLAAIISIINMSENVGLEEIKYAIEISKESDDSMEKIIRPKMTYIKMYEMLNIYTDGLTLTEMMEYGIVFRNKADAVEQISSLEELAYRKNKKIVTSGNEIKRFTIRDLELNKLDKIIASVSYSGATAPHKTINYKSVEIPLWNNGKGNSLEELCKRGGRAFCLVHFEQTSKSMEGYGHRLAANSMSRQNIIAFDIDDGMTIEEVKGLISNYTYIIYTTKSHNKPKDGVVAERFRILMPTMTTYHLKPEEYKSLYTNIAEVLGLHTYDISTKDQSRLWFTNEEADIHKNENGTLIDIRCCLPQTEESEKIMPILGDISEVESDVRIAGMIKYVVMHSHKGNRNEMMYRYSMFLKDIGESDIAGKMLYANSMIINGRLKESEVLHIANKIK